MIFKPRVLTLRRAIVLTVVLSLLIPAVLFNGYSWFRQYNDEIRNQTEERLQQNADILSTGLQEPLWNLNPESAQALLDTMVSRNPDIVRIEVRDNKLGLFVLKELASRRTGFTSTVQKPVSYKGSQLGLVEIEMSSDRLRASVSAELLNSITALAAQVALSIALIVILLERRLVRPLQRLGAGAERLAARELDVPFSWNRLDEIGMLSQRMDDTRIKLRELFETLDQKNRQLEQDIDQRERIQHELYERERRYRILVEQSPLAIIEWDIHHCVIEWNAAAEKIFGHPRPEALGKHASFIFSGASRESIDEVFHHLTTDNRASQDVCENLTAKGKRITCQWNHARVAAQSGESDRLLSLAEDITEKRHAEEALSLSEAKFAGAFQGNPDSIAIARLNDGMIIDVNHTFEKLTGYYRSEVLNKTAIELGLWADSEQHRLLVKELAINRMVRNVEWDMRTKRGLLRNCMVNATIFNVGSERYMLAVVRDITDQRLLEKQKEEADRALLRLAQGTRDFSGESFFELLVADLASALRVDCVFIGLREAGAQNSIHTLAAHIKGLPVENFRYLSTGSPCERTLKGDLTLFASGVPANFPDDRTLRENNWESYAGAPVRDAAGNPIGVLAVKHSAPLTNPELVKSLLQVFSERASSELERKRAEEALRSSEQRFSSIFQSSPVPMFVNQATDHYVIKDVNHAFEQVFRRERTSLLGATTAELELYCDPTDRDSLIRAMEETSKIEGHREVWMRRGDGSKVLMRFSGHAFWLAGEKFGIMACVDVTEMRRIESEMRELNATLEQRVIERTEELQQANTELASTVETLHKAQEELVRSEKLAALGSLVAGVAHELNTPIGNSLMVASTLADQTRAMTSSFANNELKRSALERYLGDTDKAGDILTRNLQRAADMVNSFKQVAVDQTSSQRRQFSVAEVVSEIMLTLWPTLKKTSFTVIQDISEDLRMDSYPGPLGQVMTNLVNNALLHGFAGRDSGTVSIIARKSGEDWMELTIKDDGAGIPRAHLNRIFDPFFTTKLGAGGSGLGLNIVHNIVTGILGGRISVHSEPGSGATFTISLPLSAPRKPALSDTQSDVPALPSEAS